MRENQYNRGRGQDYQQSSGNYGQSQGMGQFNNDYYGSSEGNYGSQGSSRGWGGSSQGGYGSPQLPRPDEEP